MPLGRSQSIIGDSYRDQDLVFAEEAGGFIHPDGFVRTFQRLQVRAGVPRIRFRDLRQGRNPPPCGVGTARTQHVATTLDTYSHVLPRLHQEAAERVAELMFEES